MKVAGRGQGNRSAHDTCRQPGCWVSDPGTSHSAALVNGRCAPLLAVPGPSEPPRKRPFVRITRLPPNVERWARRVSLDISYREFKGASFNVACCWPTGPPTGKHNFRMSLCGTEQRMLVSLFKIRRKHIFDPFHKYADSARQIAPMCYDECHGKRPATTIGYDLNQSPTL